MGGGGESEFLKKDGRLFHRHRTGENVCFRIRLNIFGLEMRIEVPRKSIHEGVAWLKPGSSLVH